MKYTLRYILDHRYDPNRSRERKIAERWVPINAVGKLISPYPTYLFLNLGMRPDWVTFASLFFIVVGAALLIAGYALAAALSLLCFFILDSVDGDMARCVGTTSYGSTMDSFGADFFYALVPAAVGFHLYSLGVSTEILSPKAVLVIAIFASITFLLYRIINVKMLRFMASQRQEQALVSFGGPSGNGAPPKGFFVKLLKLGRHEAVKGNFFAEPGLITWFSVLLITGLFQPLVYYLALILVNNVANVVLNMARAYMTFLRAE